MTVDEAEAAHAAALEALDAALDVDAHIAAKAHADRAAAVLEVARRRAAKERADAAHAEHVALTSELNAATERARLDALVDRLRPLIARIDELETALAECVALIAPAVEAQATACRQVRDIADRLGKPGTVPVREADLAFVRRLVGVCIARRHRGSFGSWLDPYHAPDWKQDQAEHREAVRFMEGT